MIMMVISNTVLQLRQHQAVDAIQSSLLVTFLVIAVLIVTWIILAALLARHHVCLVERYSVLCGDTQDARCESNQALLVLKRKHDTLLKSVVFLGIVLLIAFYFLNGG